MGNPTMKKILLAKDLTDLLLGKNSFLDRTDIKIYTALTSDEMLEIHRTKDIDLIVTRLDMPGIKSEDLFTIIRNSTSLRKVSTIIICKDTLDQRERCKQCIPNAVFTIPFDPDFLRLKAQQFLNVAPRKLYRAVLAVAIQGKFKNRPLPFWTENISAGGMLIRSEEPLSTGDGVFFSFFLPDGTHVSGYGEIIRVAQLTTAPDVYLYGIKFTNVDSDVKAAIESAVNRMHG